MPAARVRKPKIEDLKLTQVQLAKAKDFVEDLGIGVKDDLYYYAILWCKENERSNGDYLTPAQRKRFDEDVKKNRRSALIQKILVEITLLETLRKDDNQRLQTNTAAAAQRVASAKNKKPQTKPVNPPPSVTISIDKTEVEKGESYTVTWKSQNAIVVSRSFGFFPRIVDTELSGSKTIVANRIGSKTYGITVRNATGRAVSATTKIQVVDIKTQPDPQQPTPTTRTPRIQTTRTRITRASTAPNQALIDINNSLTNIVKMLADQNKFFANIGKIRLREAETERRKKRESILETAKGIGGKLLAKPIGQIKNIFESILKFIFLTLLGRLFTEFINWASDPKNAGKVKSITRFLKDFWVLIGGAAAYFFTPFGGFVNGVIKTLMGFSKLLINHPLVALATVAAVGSAARISETERLKPINEDIRKQTETQLQKKNIPWYERLGNIVARQEATQGQGTRPINLAPPSLYSSGGIVTPETGISVKGAGVDTQLVPVQGGGSVVLQKGEAVLQKGARERMISATGIDPLMFNTGANANKPRTIANKLTAMSTGGVVGGKYNTDLVKPQARYILQRLMQGGLTPTAAAGIVANIGVETGYTYDPNTHQRGGGPGRGLVQWEKGRGRFDVDNINLVDFAKSRKKPWNDLDTQIDFILHEMKVHPEYRDVKNKINKAKNIDEATHIFLKDYEKAGVAHTENRLAVGKELAKTGWMDPPKTKTKSQKPNNFLESLFGVSGASANERPKPRKATPKPKPRPKSTAPQRAWWDPRRLMGMKKGGIVNASWPVAGSNSDDRHLALLTAGEYIIPRVTVQTLGSDFFDNIVARTDENSNAAKITPIPRKETPITPLGSGGASAFVSLPPIMKNMMHDSTEGSTTSVPSFGAVSPMATNARSMLAEIYGIG